MTDPNDCGLRNVEVSQKWPNVAQPSAAARNQSPAASSQRPETLIIIKECWKNQHQIIAKAIRLKWRYIKYKGNQHVLKVLEKTEHLRTHFRLWPRGRQKNTSDTGMEISVSIASGGWVLEMKKETVIYFEQLGFGWVLDHMILKEINFTKLQDECITDTSLIKIIENMLIGNPNF